jgi:hypothetical protein
MYWPIPWGLVDLELKAQLLEYSGFLFLAMLSQCSLKQSLLLA